MSNIEDTSCPVPGTIDINLRLVLREIYRIGKPYAVESDDAAAGYDQAAYDDSVGSSAVGLLQLLDS